MKLGPLEEQPLNQQVISLAPLSFKFSLFQNYACICVWVCASEYRYPCSPEEGARVISCELFRVGAGTQTLQEKYVLLPTEPSLQCQELSIY